MTYFLSTVWAFALLGQTINIPSFVYHRFGESNYPSTNITLAVFKTHLSYLQQKGYRVITLSKALQAIQQPNPSIEDMAVLTIDDGYQSVITNAFPMLQQFDFPATLFVSTEMVGIGNQLSWAEIRQLDAAGWEIGIHSHSHDHFLDYPKKDRKAIFEQDLVQSITQFEQNLGYAPTLYAYPYGEYDNTFASILQNYGIKAAAAQHSGVISSFAPLYALPRFPMNEAYGNSEAFQQKVQTVALPVTDIDYEGPATINKKKPAAITITLDSLCPPIAYINCFWNGQSNCSVKKMVADTNKYQVSIEAPFSQRRGKVTLTAPGPTANSWYWYSIPFFRSKQ